MSPRSSARSAPREAATQHITLDAVKCIGSPRTSQIPWSGSCQRCRAASTNPASPHHGRGPGPGWPSVRPAPGAACTLREVTEPISPEFTGALIRTDSGGGIYEFLGWRAGRRLRYGIGMTTTDYMQDAILTLPERDLGGGL